MEINKKNKKELIGIYREKVAGGKTTWRFEYLAYAFIRGMPYVALERTINEDSFGKVGRNTFLGGLASQVASSIFSSTYGKGYYEFYYDKDLSKETKELYSNFKEELRKEVLNWVMSKYILDVAEAAE